jgi:hypothetical protein
MTYINIDLGEMHDDLTNREKEKLADWLDDDGYFNPTEELFYPTPSGIEDEDVVNSLRSLLTNRHLLSTEDRQLIIKLAGKV